MLKVIDRGRIGFGICQMNTSVGGYYSVRWLLSCGHMTIDWHKECKCEPRTD